MALPIQVKQSNWGFQAIWQSIAGDWPVEFFQYTPYNATDDFAVLGDYIAVGTDWPPKNPGDFAWSYLPDPSCPWSLAHPVDFTWLLDDAGSGIAMDVNYWWPVAPPNYWALGVCFTPNDKPNPQNYWCVHNDFVFPTSQSVLFWSDSGQGWQHDGNLNSIASDIPGSIIPTTLLSAQGMAEGMGVPAVIVNDPPNLSPPHPPPMGPR